MQITLKKLAGSWQITLLLLFALLDPVTAVASSKFFKISETKVWNKEPKDKGGVWDEFLEDGKKKQRFVPSIEVKVSTEKMIRARDLKLIAYFFDPGEKVVHTKALPTVAQRDPADRDKYDVPVFFSSLPESIFFRIPTDLLTRDWSAIIVFGDSHEVFVKRLPSGDLFSFDFPEKKLAISKSLREVTRPTIEDPVIEHVVHTQNSKHPRITLLLRFPEQITKPSEIRGVLALCVLAGSVGEIKRNLQNADPAHFNGLLKFADRENLAVVCWGARSVWRPGANYDELEKETNKELDRSFNQVATAWERGILELNKKYGIPTENFLISGVCNSAQWAHRLVLQKPRYFLAAFIHIPNSFGKPTPAASKVLWLITTGELDGGYDRGRRFYRDCKAAGYPVIYKPIVGLGHSRSPIADNLGITFFKYALSISKSSENASKGRPSHPNASPDSWRQAFDMPPFVGDYLNQEIFPYSQRNKIPAAFQVPLPTKEIAEAWNK